jgi:hypothetical protein
MGLEGIGSFGAHPIPSDDLLKQAKLSDIKTSAGKTAYVLLHGDKKVGHIMNGITKAGGALKWIAKVLEEKANG